MPIVRTTVRNDGSYVGGPGYNVWHLRVRDGFAATDLGTMLGNLEEFYSIVARYQPSGGAFVSEGDFVDVQTGEFEQVSGFSVPTVGGDVGYMPSQTCIVAGWQTSVRTRSGRGRTFLGPLRVTDCEANGTPTETVREAIQGAGQDLIAAQSGVSQDFGAWGVWSPTQQVIRDFTACSVRNVFAHLTSRRV